MNGTNTFMWTFEKKSSHSSTLTLLLLKKLSKQKYYILKFHHHKLAFRWYLEKYIAQKNIPYRVIMNVSTGFFLVPAWHIPKWHAKTKCLKKLMRITPIKMNTSGIGFSWLMLHNLMHVIYDGFTVDVTHTYVLLSLLVTAFPERKWCLLQNGNTIRVRK